ncbi:MAG TPA: hypothetical protein PLF30_03545 [Candidatus Moranbacteria bacterium]|nr:hypothetical protein [Candidatus Moranbacteria bacterium]HQB59803.1 hypothetical protein [Candidatus Moranbacteria bacterium]
MRKTSFFLLFLAFVISMSGCAGPQYEFSPSQWEAIQRTQGGQAYHGNTKITVNKVEIENVVVQQPIRGRPVDMRMRSTYRMVPVMRPCYDRMITVYAPYPYDYYYPYGSNTWFDITIGRSSHHHRHGWYGAGRIRGVLP